ncbi:LPXTG cell wall anchor domain-containing protein, partial [Isoptericola sp. NPDC060282]
DGERGDNTLGNFLLDPGQDPPDECTDDNPDCTINPVPELVDSKSVDPESGTAVAAGDTVTYTLTFQNTGTAPATVDRVDDLSGVLDDTEFVADSIVVDPDDTVAASFNADRIVIVGEVPAAATVTVTYQVTVLPDGERGDNSLGNFLLDPGQDPPETCTDDNPDCTVNPAPPGDEVTPPPAPDEQPPGPAPAEPQGPSLPRTGADLLPFVLLSLLLTGAGLVIYRRTRPSARDGRSGQTS